MKLSQTTSVDDFFLLEEVLPIMSKSVGVGAYDFDFRNHFRVRSLHNPPEQAIVARIGAFKDYRASYTELVTEGMTMVHTPEEHDLCSLLPLWYPIIEDLTPKSIVYSTLPSAKTVEQDFNWPIFVKGERQTHKHKKQLSIIENKAHFDTLLEHWKNDSMLHWQRMVCRQYIPLQLVDESIGERLPSSYEFRLFYWKQQLVSVGRYWHEASPYGLLEPERAQVIALADEVARRLAVCFLVVDLAKTTTGQWLVIEANDGQESGYAGNHARLLWENIIGVEHRRKG